MGVRLTILDENDNILYYGSKLYGYVDSLEQSKSLKYLWDNHSEFLIKERGFEDYEDFVLSMEIVYWTEKTVKLSIPQLKEYLKLYDEDLKTWGREYTISDEAEKEIPAGVESVWLEWG
jgi:hypothetical protein